METIYPMRKIIRAAIAIWVILALPSTSHSQPDSPVKVRIIRNVRYAPQPEGVYASDTASDRTLDLYLPENSTKAPVILFVHGGGFSGGHKHGTRFLCERLSEEGFAVISINYRLYLKHHKTPGASATANMSRGVPSNGQFHPALQKAIEIASDDAYLALQWVIQNASQYNLDASRLAISGGSAGGMTALHSAYINPAFKGKVKAVVNLWGGMADVTKVRRKSPPILTYHGDQDKTIHVDFAYAIDRRMKELKIRDSKLVVLENMGHALYKYITSDRCEEIATFLNKVL